MPPTAPLAPSATLSATPSAKPPATSASVASGPLSTSPRASVVSPDRPPGGPAPAVQDTPIQIATGLIRQTGDEIRQPVAAARRSIAMIRDGHAGPITPQQQSLLTGAIQHCDAATFSATQMQRCELDSMSIAGVHPQWTTVAEILNRSAVAIGSVQTRGVHVRVDQPIDPSTKIYTDPAAAAELIGNLLLTAARTGVVSKSVCLRIVADDETSTARVCVIDRGVGIANETLTAMTQPGYTPSGSLGLGLSIARRLATALQTTLQIRSGVRQGTETSFSMPMATDIAVAASYGRWRLAIQPARMQPRRRRPAERKLSLPDRPQQRVVSLGPSWQRPTSATHGQVAMMTLGALMPTDVVEQFNTILHRCVSTFDLFYAIDPRHYLCVIDAPPRQWRDRIEDLRAAINQRVPGARMQWNQPISIAIDPHTWIARLSDIMVRQSLQRESTTEVFDRDQIRPGTESFAGGDRTAARLDAEMRRLGTRIGKQTDTLRSQAAKMRRTDNRS